MVSYANRPLMGISTVPILFSEIESQSPDPDRTVMPIQSKRYATTDLTRTFTDRRLLTYLLTSSHRPATPRLRTAARQSGAAAPWPAIQHPTITTARAPIV
jgi:hypothetical protein